MQIKHTWCPPQHPARNPQEPPLTADKIPSWESGGTRTSVLPCTCFPFCTDTAQWLSDSRPTTLWGLPPAPWVPHHPVTKKIKHHQQKSKQDPDSSPLCRQCPQGAAQIQAKGMFVGCPLCGRLSHLLLHLILLTTYGEGSTGHILKHANAGLARCRETLHIPTIGHW